MIDQSLLTSYSACPASVEAQCSAVEGRVSPTSIRFTRYWSSRVFVNDSPVPVQSGTDLDPAGKSISYFNCEEPSRLGSLGHQGHQEQPLYNSTSSLAHTDIKPDIISRCWRKYLNSKNISDGLFQVIFRMNEDHQSVPWKIGCILYKIFLQVYFNCAGSFPKQPAPWCSPLPPSFQSSKLIINHLIRDKYHLRCVLDKIIKLTIFH